MADGNFLQSLPEQILIGIIVLAITSFIGYLFREKIRIFIRSIWYKIYPNDFRYNLVFSYVFENKVNDLDSTVFQNIKRDFESLKITKASIRPESMTIRSDTLGVKVHIYIDSLSDIQAVEHEKEDDVVRSEINEYKLSIKFDSELHLLSTKIDMFSEYIALFEGIKENAREYCFNNDREKRFFILCDINRGDIKKIYSGNSISNENGNTKISFVNNNIKIKSNKSSVIVGTIKKYLGY